MSDRLLLDTCGCCDDELPQPTLANPPGQAALRYRMSVHGEFVARMVVQLSRQRFPLDNPDAPRPLHALTARAPDDFAIGLIDAWAVMGDVLTFYQERIVNEGFLRTATERRSVLELARTIGYELSPGVAAETLLVFTVDEADATPDTSEIAAGTQVQSIPREQDELPQTFETSEGLVAHVDWNAMRPRQTETQLVSSATTMLTFTGLGNNLQIGDRLLLIDPALEDAWEVRRITAVKTEPARNRTHVTVTAGSVNKLWRPAVYVFRQRANIFGHNAGEWTGLGKQVRADYWGVAVDDLAKNDTGQWPEYTICAPAGGTRKRSAKITARQVADAALQAAELQAKIMTRSTIAGAPEVLLAGGVALTALAGGLRTNLEAQTADVLAMVNIVPDADSTAATALAEIARGLTDIIGAISIETGSLPSFSVSPPTIDFSPDALVDTAENLTEYVTEVSEYLAEALPSIAAVLPKLLIDSPAVADALATIFTELQTLFRTLNPLQSVIDLVTGEQPELGNVAEQAGRLMQRATSAGAATMGFHGLQAVLESALLLDPSAEEVRQLALSTAGLAANAAGTASGDVESVSALASQYGGIGGFETMLESSFQPLLLMNTGVVDGVERVQAAVEAALDQYAIVVQDDDKDCTKIDLDGRYDKITPESWVYLLAGGEGELFDVAEVEETSRAEYQISLEVTRLTLARAALDSFEKKVRETKVYGAPEPLELAAIDIANAVQGTVIYLDRLVQLPPAGATLIVAGAPAAGVPAVDDSDAPEVREAVELKRATQQGGQTRLEFTRALRRAYHRASVQIYGNVVNASHGETVADEALGGGDGTQPHQRFTLRKPPLTYVAAATPSGSASTLTVRVDGVAWTQQPSLYGLAPDARGYIVRIDDDGQSHIIFGDGKMGARTPTGQENVRAGYRSGIGLAGEVGAGALTLLKTRPYGIRSVTNPLPADGADDPETLDNARQNAPLTVRTLDRVVSLRDYEDFARAFAGIGKAQATVVWNGRRELIHLTVTDPTGAPAPQSTLGKLREALEAARDPGQPICLAPADVRAFALQAGLLIDPAYERAAVEDAAYAALRAAFIFAARELAQPVTAAAVTSVMQGVAGVMAVDLDYLYLTDEPVALRSVLVAERAHYQKDAGGGCASTVPAHLLLIDPAGVTLKEIGP